MTTTHPTDFTRAGLEHAGFQGFVPLLDLDPTLVPREHGVYVVVREHGARPAYLEESPAGKRIDLTVPIADLESGWLDGAIVVYIGKAGGKRAHLRTRLRAYSRSGQGLVDNHRGGRRIWQLADHTQLLVAWLPTPGEDAEEVERGLIGQFVDACGATPFANRTRGTRRRTPR